MKEYFSALLTLILDHGYIDRNGLDHVAVQKDVMRFALSLDVVGGAITATSPLQDHGDEVHFRSIKARKL